MMNLRKLSPIILLSRSVPREGTPSLPQTRVSTVSVWLPLGMTRLAFVTPTLAMLLFLTRLPLTRTFTKQAARGNKTCPTAAMPESSSPRSQPAAPRNVLGGPLQACCTAPQTGYFRDGQCRTDATDSGVHTVCAVVSRAFLEFSAARGNNLMTPNPAFGFPGLRDGDRWCLCAGRWVEAWRAGCAPRVVLESTEERTLEFVGIDVLREFAVEEDDVGGSGGRE